MSTRRLPHIPSFVDLNKVVLGLVFMALTAVTLGGAVAVGALGLFSGRYDMSGVFADSAGMRAGASVQVAGIKVGKVTKVTPDYETGQVIIDWEVDAGVHLGPDTRAEVASRTLLGGDLLRLTNTTGGESLESRPRLERRIPLSRTSVPYTLVQAFGDTTEDVKAIDVGTVDRVVGEIAGILDDNAMAIPDLVDKLGVLATAIDQREAQLNHLIENGQQVVATLSSRDQQLLVLIDQGAALLDALNRRKDQLTSLLGSSNSIVVEISDLIETKRGEIDRLLGDLRPTLAAIDRLDTQINEGLAYTGPTFAALAGGLGPGGLNAVVTGIGPASLNVLTDFLDAFLGPEP